MCIINYNYNRNKYNLDNIENFDGKIRTRSEYECANKCSGIYGCAGFTFDNKTNTCYLSKTPIAGKPVNTLFGDDFATTNQYTCNKVFTIMNQSQLEASRYNLNRAYNCYTNYNIVDPQVMNYYEVNTSETLSGPTNLDELKIQRNIDDHDIKNMNTSPYKIIGIDWPNNIKDNQTFILEANGGNLPTDESIYKYVTFIEDGDEHIGEYEYSHECSENIDKYDCLKMCNGSKKCTGVEWNPFLMINRGNKKYEIHKNVCCPKTNIVEIIKRRPIYLNGKFYIKKVESNLDNNKIYISEKN
jgi:hypothetical protein